MELLLDYREEKIIKLIQNDTSINFKIQNLQLGDFILQKDNKICFIIERKTLKDLSSSIIDGRYSEQKQRLKDSGCEIVYIIENPFCKMKYGIPKKNMDCAILNLIFIHNFKIIFTENENETLFYLCNLYKKIKNNEILCSNLENNEINLSSKIDKNKKDIFINQLTCIPNVSITIARKINEKYNSMYELIDNYTKCDNEKSKKLMLTCIQISEKRKLGKILSEKIYNSIFYGNLLKS